MQIALSPVDEELARFGGYPGGAHPATWQLRPNVQTHSGQSARITHTRPLFPQPCSVASGLVTTQVKLLGRLLTVVSAAEQLKLLHSMQTALADLPQSTKGRKPLEPAQVRVVLTHVCGRYFTAHTAWTTVRIDVTLHTVHGVPSPAVPAALATWKVPGHVDQPDTGQS